ncbi:uncharacterized protein MKK02DRAFT_27942 [Dioszegia hungarica]|uniref:HIT-type domain-containing protein n=1 Tax=Dioszegia hungarica TaxID=4972 RepID=A0AA38LTL8_9TREE|nr:uncharacterized protein MKK02DRAFT_27942 [Dioszegia hungarica]KAI9634798.1 hypothetical protein MKK02DRAFT_27942 [Dioszegia hungarica]
MVFALPAKPAFLGPPPATTTLQLLPPPSAISSSSSDHGGPSSASLISYPPLSAARPEVDTTKCALCALPPKYTCPRCSRRTCSLPCSTGHKAKYSCDGIRQAEGYVSLREYGQGDWAEDYRYLEEGRRRVEGWGQGVREEEMVTDPRGGDAEGSRGRGGARGGRGGRGGGTRGPKGKKSKSQILQMELRSKGVWAEFMPDGMARRRQNQSACNKQAGTVNLTVQLSIPQPLLPPDKPDSTEADFPKRLGTEVIDHNTPKLFTHTRVLFAHPTQPLPNLHSLLPPLMLTASDIVFLLPFFPSPARPAPPVEDTASRAARLFFPPLDPELPFADVFRGTAWVEFPTVHIMSKVDWERGLKKGEVGVVPLAQAKKRGADDAGIDAVTPRQWGGERDSGWGIKGKKVQVVPVAKKQKVELKRPDATAALGALGDYASDDEDEAGVGEEGQLQEDDADDSNDAEEGEDGELDGDEEDDDDAVYDLQPGHAGSLLAGVPRDLLIAMSHAIEADMA